MEARDIRDRTERTLPGFDRNGRDAGFLQHDNMGARFRIETDERRERAAGKLVEGIEIASAGIRRELLHQCGGSRQHREQHRLTGLGAGQTLGCFERGLHTRRCRVSRTRFGEVEHAPARR